MMTDQMPTNENPQAPEGGDRLYGAAYYRHQLHRAHWFRDNHRKNEMRWEAVLRMLQPAAHDIVLDLGCAIGAHALRIAPLVKHVTGIDSSPVAVRLALEGAHGMANVEFVEADATAMAGVADASVDKIMAIDFVEHIDDLDLAHTLDAAWRVLRPRGRLAIYTPCRSHYVEQLKARNVLPQIPGHIAVRTPRQCEELFAQLPWRIVDRFFLPSTYPLFGLFDRALAPLPVIGAWFRFRYCVALEKDVAR